MALRCLRVVLRESALYLFSPDERFYCHLFVKSRVCTSRKMNREALTAKGSPRQPQCLRPEYSRRIGEFHHPPHCECESIHLRIFDCKWRSDLQHHEVVPAHLRQKTEIAEHPH